MTSKRYTNLLAEFCKAAHLDEPEKLIETGQVWVDDMAVNFHYVSDQESEVIQIFIEIAELPWRPEHCYRRLLEFNFLVHRYGTGLVCIAPGSGSVSYALIVRIEMSLTGQDLANILDKGMTQACWIKENYLADQAEEKTQSQFLVPLA